MTALHPSHSLGLGSLRSRASWEALLSLLAVVEMGLADIRHHTEAEMVAGVVEDQKMTLALGGAKPTPDGLDKWRAASLVQRSLDDVRCS